MNLQALTIDQLAELLTAARPAGTDEITTDQLAAMGLPTNPDGSYHLVHVTAALAAQ